MHPVYMWGGPYPYHANPTRYAANGDPRAKEISSQMKMDPTSMSSPYQPWPYGGNYCYPGPQECHGGYNHGCFGGPYGFQPPYPYYPPSPYHSHGFHSPFPGAYPAYSIPPPHYSVEQPRYDYDRNAHGSHHCCGCNHREDEKKSMVKQEEPETEKKTNDSLIPFLLKDYPYPIMWVPPGLLNTEPKAKEKEKHTHDRVPLEPLEPSKQDGNGETDRNQHDGDEKRLPFPIFWFPSNEVGEKNVDSIAQKGSPLSRNDDKKKQMKINDEAESDTGIKPLARKVIPVKQLGSEEEKNPPKSIETKAKSASVDKTDNSNEGKASPKTPKLPPVCLRVDPLPRKKNTSRSPSPPGDKIRSKGSTVNESRSSQQQTQLSEGLKKSNEEQNVRTIKVIESNSVGDRCENVSNGSEKGIVCKEGKKKLSENEAALIVQSVCRGFQVRKSKPITKLRQIAEVGKRVVELRNRVHGMESSCFDNKEKLVIGETIMSLLLKLDTIQGLHPVVREVRKCVAKELVGLQEKLDSLKPEPPIEQDTTKRVKEDDKSETQPNSNPNFVESPNTNLEPETELQNEENTEEVNNNQLLDDDVIQDKLGGKDDDDEKSETQSDSNVKSAMINNEDGTNVDEESSGELNKDKQLLYDVIKDRLPQADGNGESGGRDYEMEQKVAEESSKGQMSEQAADAIEAESGTNVEPQSTEGVTKNQMETDTAAESGTKLQTTEEVTKNEMESDTAAESGTYMEPQITEEVTKNQMETHTAAESGTSVEPQITEEVTKNQTASDTAAESGTYVEPQSTEEVTKNQTASDTAAESGTNVKPQSREEVTKNQVEMLSDEENVEVGDVQSEEKPKEEEEEDSVKAMEEVVKEQMDVIRELAAKVKDLEKKLLKVKNKKMKKANKGRKSRGYVVDCLMY